MRILVTGAAGFIGYHLSHTLLCRGDQVIGLDNLNPYYDVNLKLARLEQLQHPNFQFKKIDLADQKSMQQLFQDIKFDCVVNLGAQAGVRYSTENPQSYIDSNLVGFGNILEGCRAQQTKNLVFASTSSVYGANTSQPFSEHNSTEHPISLYAATKKANEMMAHSYAYMYGLPCTGLRFFTVYGPWGRPDMALFKFTKNMLENKPIDVYNHGNMSRDFTYIDDIIKGIIHVIDNPAKANSTWSGQNPDPATSQFPYRIYNIGNNNPVKLMDFIEALEIVLGKQAIKNFMPMQAGDVPSTYADVTDLETAFGFKPQTSIVDGVNNFVKWYLNYINKNKLNQTVEI